VVASAQTLASACKPNTNYIVTQITFFIEYFLEMQQNHGARPEKRKSMITEIQGAIQVTILLSGLERRNKRHFV
jgi:hypothetical protein